MHHINKLKIGFFVLMFLLVLTPFGTSFQIFNVQSYPIVGDSWTTSFNATNKADLKITPFNGTLFNQDLEFVSLKCGDRVVEPTELTDLYVKFDNYYCFSESHFEVKVLTSGKHTLRFEFGNDVDYSYNNASDPEIILKEEPVITWKDNCQTRCIDGKCNTILGRTIWVNDSDGTCKEIEKANSLKNGFYIEYLEKDPDFNLTVSEFNISYMNMTLDFVGNPADYPTFCQVTDALNAKCDFKLDEKWDEYDEEGNVTEKKQLKFQYKWEMKQGVVIKGDKVKYEYKENTFGKKFSFGGNSTTIQLQDANTENLDDVHVVSDDPNSNYGITTSLTLMDIFGGELMRTYIKFNISAVPLGQVIDDSVLCLYYDSCDICFETGLSVDVHHVYNKTWVEGSENAGDASGQSAETNTTWNNQVCGTGFDDSDQCNLTAEDSLFFDFETQDSIFWCWNVTSSVKQDYDENYNNVSLILKPQSEGENLEILTFDSKEGETVAQRPYLNITYSEAPPDTTPPTYSDNSTNSTLAGTSITHNLKWTDETGLATSGGYVFSFDNGTGTLVNDSWVAFSSNPDWSNVTKTVNSTVGTTINWRVHANDTSGNWNNSETFSYVTSEAVTQQLFYNSTDKLWYLNITVPAGTGLEDLYLEAEYTTDSVTKENTESNAIRYVSLYSRLVSSILSISESISRTVSYVRVITQEIALTELVTNIQNFFRTLSDSIGITELTENLQNFFRTLSDSFNFTEIATRIRTIPRTIADSFNINELLIRLGFIQRTPADTLTISELIDESYVFSRKLSDSITISELTDTISYFQRENYDSVTFGELLDRLGLFDRESQDKITLYELLVRTGYFNRKLEDSISLNEILTYLRSVERTGQDSLTFGELLIRLGIFQRKLTDTLAVSETIYKSGIFPKDLSDTLTLSELTETISYFQRTEQDSITVAELLERLGLFDRESQDSIKLYDLLYKSGIFPKQLSDSFTLNELLKALSEFQRKGTDSITFNELLTRLGIIIREPEQALSFNEIINRIRTVPRTIYQSLNINELIARITSIFRTTQDTLTVSETIYKSGIFEKDLSDSIKISELDETVAYFQRQGIDSITLNELLIKLGLFSREAQDDITFFESIYKLRISGLITRNIYDSISLDELIDIINYFKRENYDSITFNELLVRLRIIPRDTADSFTFSDLITRMVNFFRKPTDTLTVSEQIDRIGIFKRSTTDSIKISELEKTIFYFQRKEYDSVTFGELLEKLGLFDRTSQDSLNLYESLFRIRTINRKLEDSISLNELLNILNSFQRTGQDSVTFNELLIRLGIIERETTDSFTFNDLAERVRTVPRTISDSISFNELVRRPVNYFRNLFQSLVIRDSIAGWLTCEIGETCPEGGVTIYQGGGSVREIVEVTIEKAVEEREEALKDSWLVKIGRSIFPSRPMAGFWIICLLVILLSTFAIGFIRYQDEKDEDAYSFLVPLWMRSEKYHRKK